MIAFAKNSDIQKWFEAKNMSRSNSTQNGNPHAFEFKSVIETKECPICKWKGFDYGDGAGFSSSVKGIEGDWCLRCWIKKSTKGIPKLQNISK